MSRLTQLHKNPKHEQAENTPYILRLRFKNPASLPSKVDCILLSEQYVALYAAMAQRLSLIEVSSASSFLNLFRGTPPWIGRAQVLQDDINEMIGHLSSTERDALSRARKLYPATKAMISDIENADAVRLFAWYAVRYLGDVFGGQALNAYTQRTFASTPLQGNFYGQVSTFTQTLSIHVNQAYLFVEEDKRFLDAADSIFQYHIDLFNEMECDRPVIVERPSVLKNRYVLFGLSAIVVGAAYMALTEPSR